MKKIILASSSPRRIELLKNAGFRFSSLSPNINEEVRRNELPKRLVLRLSKEKAFFIASQTKTHSLIIAADTIVVDSKGSILNKPSSRANAISLLKKIAGKKHHVYTGYTVVEVRAGQPSKIKQRIIKTTVQMRSLDAKGIRHYLNLGESMDKAGAYAAQGHGMNLIESINGSYTNVVGLPMAELIQDLKKIFKYPCPF